MVLVGATVALAQSPTPTPTATATATPTPTPVPTLPGCPPDVEPSPLAPTAPTDMRIEALGAWDGYWRYSLQWQDNSDDETCFGLEKRLDDGPWQWGGPLPAGVTGYVIDVNFPGRLCERVYAGNQAGRSDYSNVACVDLPPPSTPPGGPTPTPPTVETPMPSPPACNSEGPIGSPGAPSPPTDLRAEVVKDFTVLNGAVRLEWYDNAGNDTCYFLERKADGGAWLRQWASYPAGPEHTGLVSASDFPGQVGVHCYRIFYANGAGRSGYSNEVCLNVEVVPTVVAPTPPPWPCHPRDDPPYSELAPSPPTDLTATLVGDPTVSGGLSVRLVWQHFGIDELCYRAQRLELDGTWQWFATGSGSGEIDTQPLPGARCYRVAVANEHGRSDWSNEACATGEPTTPTPAATGLATAVPRALPITGGGPGRAGHAWFWWALAAASTALLGVAALSLAKAARDRRLPSR